MKSLLIAVGALLAASVSGLPAQAATAIFSFSGGAFSGSGVFTITPNVSPPDPNPLCGTAGNNACRADPPGAWAITGVTGTFSDTNLGISNAAITGLVPIHPANERDPTFDPLVPTSLSFVNYSLPAPGALTYNNLFFTAGSPIDCAYPFSGTFLDVFGAAFTVEGGLTVDLWGDGAEPVLGLTYGVGVTDGVRRLDYQFDGVSASARVPEPSTWALLLAGFGGLGWNLRRARSRAGQACA
ncbi:PEP-CTERM sorting domain-containing protein [Phenylobacterium sp.]|uniref:PEP-CTERM sorting domain-containing protein n=1 Tax=Phenylobacterium sp. TaxID=1871053 RepID=UPI002F41010F